MVCSVEAAWATAQRQVALPVGGYLGAVANSPISSLLDDPMIVAGMRLGLASAFPEPKLNKIFAPDGGKLIEAVLETDAGVASTIALLSEGEFLQPDWRQDPGFQKYHSLVFNGGKKIRGPLLVIHGESDTQLSSEVATHAVNNIADRFPSSQLEYILLPHVKHAPALAASHRLWMDWIADRFAGRESKSYCQLSKLPHARPGLSYQVEKNWYLEPAKKFYHAP